MSERGGSDQRENSYSDEVGAVGGREGNVKGVEMMGLKQLTTIVIQQYLIQNKRSNDICRMIKITITQLTG